MTFRPALVNVRKPRELEPNEHAGFVRLIDAVAALQRKPRPAPEPKRSARSA